VSIEPASGRVPECCPRCGKALQSLVMPTIIKEVAAIPADAIADPVGDGQNMANAEPALMEPRVPDALPDEKPTPEPDPDLPGAVADVDSPVDVQPAPATVAIPGRVAVSPVVRRLMMMASIPILTLILALQCLLADRVQLAADARWRPLVSMLCNALHCRLPPWRQPSAFVLLDRNVRADPRRPGVLHVEAGFRNDARWPQPWPALLLTLSDADGRVAGERLFAPSEYLGAMPTQNELASGQSASIAMDVMEPASDVVAFTFDLR
ncbi:MAG: hypothetical protein JWL98_246, partial [Xanthomonadaceae bacterium]|nr:hypothetical protein [Xanthomonadaceae bacterium]